MRTNFIASLALVMVTYGQAKNHNFADKFKNFMDKVDEHINEFVEENPDALDQLANDIADASEQINTHAQNWIDQNQDSVDQIKSELEKVQQDGEFNFEIDVEWVTEEPVETILVEPVDVVYNDWVIIEPVETIEIIDEFDFGFEDDIYMQPDGFDFLPNFVEEEN